MKKAFLLATVLFISVISTACINNFAVQELNNKAQEFMNKGDYTSAIERLKSSIDLDGDVFETRYNLAVAYTKAEDYDNAIKAYDEVIKLNPDFADAYYSLAVCEENLAKDLISKELYADESNNIQKYEDEEDTELTDNSKKMIKTLLNNSISDYKIYLDKSTSGDENEIQEKITELENLLSEQE